MSQKWAKGPSKDLLRRSSRKSAKKALRVKMKWEPFGGHFPLKIPSKIHPNIDREKTLKIIPKGFQNGADIDAKTHQKSMPKLVSKKIRKIMKIHVFLKG